ncbi:hypothetical protein DVH24_016881 [Malus domestica]|uniref:Uncharacterized protein n=1 Tax=Malus domestica TaxID=3750 RepID=A0A498IQR1_MALDO|nr:hypothetical protein DVH24_016881 [Malus domestica]
MLPSLLPHNALIIVSSGVNHRLVFCGNDKPVVDARHHLTVAPDDALKHQLVLALGLLGVLRHRELCDLFHMGVAHVLYGLPTAGYKTPSIRGSGHRRKEDEGEDEEAVRAHRDR